MNIWKFLLFCGGALLSVTNPTLSTAQNPGYVFFVPLQEHQIHNAFRILYTSTGKTYHSVVSIVPSQSSTPANRKMVFYDHWEDGYEANIFSPAQPTTWIFGDGISSNNGPYSDTVVAGKPLVLENDLAIPSNPAIIKADGGDKIASPASLSCARSGWALKPGTVLADAVEFLNTQSFGTSFIIPIGQNTSANGMFSLTSLHVQAAHNGTQVLIDTDGNGVNDITAIINQGESYQVNGGMMQSATVNTSKPVQVILITGLPSANYECRWYNIYPVALWDKGYWTPVATTSSNGQSHVFLYNPTTATLPVTVHTSSNINGSIVMVPPKGTYRYIMPYNSSAYFDHPSVNFFAIGAADADAGNHSTWDWGYSLIPEDYLTTSFYVGWGEGAFNSPQQNGNPVWVGAASLNTNTLVYVDLDGNPATGPLTDINGNKYDYTLSVPPLGSMRIYDPDNDQTGIHAYTLTGTEIIGAWGEDASKALAGNPFLDVGTTVSPDPVLRLWKKASLDLDLNSNGLADAGDRIRWKIYLYNQTLQSYPSVIVKDELDSHLSYITNSTLFNNLAVPDNITPATPFPLDAQGLEVNSISSGSVDSIVFLTLCTSTGDGITHIPNVVTVTNSMNEIIRARDSIAVYTPGVTQCTVVFTGPDFGAQINTSLVNSTLYVKVTDGDQNVNPGAPDQVRVKITNPSTSDEETIILIETGNASGIFTGSLQSSGSIGSGSGNSILYASTGNSINVLYQDLFFGGNCQAAMTITLPLLSKPLYFSDPDNNGATILDRVDPVNSSDLTASLSTVLDASGGAQAITAVSTTPSTQSNGTTLTFSHTPGTGMNRLLIVGVTVGGNTYTANGAAISSVKFNNVNMTPVGAPVTIQGVRAGIYYMLNPPAGPANVVITVNSASSIAAGATTFTGVNQVTPFGTYATNSFTGGGSAVLNNVASATGEVVYSIACTDEGNVNQSITPGVNQTLLWSYSGFDFVSGIATTKPGASTVSFSYLLGDSQEWIALGVPIKPVTGTGNPSVTFSQLPAMCESFTISANGTIKVKLWLSDITGTMPANPSVSCTLKNGSNTIVTLQNPVFTDNTGTNQDTLVFTGSISPETTLAAGNAISAVITNAQPGVTFQIRYDSQSAPSRIDLPTSTVIDMNSLAIYNAAYPSGSAVTTAINGQKLFVRATVTDPFGSSDIDPGSTASLVITAPSGSPVTVSMALAGTTSCGKIYEYEWNTPVTQGTYTLTATSYEGYENQISSSRSSTVVLTFLDTGTPCNIAFTAPDNTTVVSNYSGAAGYSVCVRVNDMDRNTSTARQSVTVNINAAGSTNDQESLLLLENESTPGSGIYNTGIFTGCIPASNISGTGNNSGVLLAPEGSTLSATYSDPENNSDVCISNAVVVTLGATAASITKTLVFPSDSIAVVGDSVIWRIVISNPGNTTLSEVNLSDIRDTACLSFAGATPPPAAILSDGTLTWNTSALGGPILPGSIREVMVRFIAAGGCGDILNTAAVTGTAAAGPVTSPVKLIDPSVSIQKTKISPDPPIYAGTQLVYQITLTNNGTTAIESLPLTDAYSATNLAFVSASPPPDASGGGNLLWSDLLPGTQTLAVGASVNITVTFSTLRGNYPLPVSNNAITGFDASDIFSKPVPPVSSGVDVMVLNVPQANPDEFTMIGNITGTNHLLNGIVTSNDFSPDGLVLTVNTVPVIAPLHASSFILHADGSFTYRPADGYTGDDTFTYRVCDSNNYCLNAVVTIHILQCTNPPERPGDLNKN